MTRILIIDDDPSIRALMADALADEGYTVRGLDAPAGIAHARAVPPDLIILDVMMPTLDGPQVAAELRANPRTASIPIVLCTAFSQPERWFASMGAAAILPKPFRMQELFDLVQRFAPQERTTP